MQARTLHLHHGVCVCLCHLPNEKKIEDAALDDSDFFLLLFGFGWSVVIVLRFGSMEVAHVDIFKLEYFYSFRWTVIILWVDDDNHNA